jgi:uncharacterized protein
MSVNYINVHETQAHTPSGAHTNSLKSKMQRHPIASYLLIMYAGLTLAYLPLLLSKHGFGVLPIEFPFPVVLFNLPASLFGPLLAGAVMSWVVGGKEARREYRRSLFRVRIAPQWYLIALIGVPVAGVLSVAVAQGISPVSQLLGQIGAFASSYLFTALVGALIINLWEESGQMGFVTPEVQRTHGPLLASLVVAVTWAFMHLPPIFVPEMGIGVGGPLSLEGLALNMAVLVAYALPVRFIATWLFNSARQSVVLVALFHAAMNATQGEFGKLIPGYNSFYLIGAFAVISFVLIAATRGKLRYKPHVESAYPGDVAQPAAAPLAQA